MTALEPTQPGSFFRVQERDILAELLNNKRSQETKRAYARDLKYFFVSISGHEPNPQLIAEFLKLERATAIGLVLNYKAQLIEKGLAEATVNRRLAAIKSLVKFAQDIDKCAWSLEAVTGERVQTYRDTSGVDVETYQKLLAIPDRSTLKGKRDYALLRLLWDNALRRGEVSKCNIEDLDPGFRKLRILGKGRGTQMETIDLSSKTTEALWAWVEARGGLAPTQPLFVSVDRVNCGHRLTGDGIYKLVRGIAEQAGISKRLSPHRCRHSSITAALNVSNGDVRRVQKLSRHKKLDVLLVYDDARKGLQGEVTNLLSDLID